MKLVKALCVQAYGGCGKWGGGGGGGGGIGGFILKDWMRYRCSCFSLTRCI